MLSRTVKKLGQYLATLTVVALVLLAAREVQWAEVVAELERRSGTSGWVEKEARVEDES